MSEKNDVQDVLIKLAKLEQQLVYAHENHIKMSEIQSEIFSKIDLSSKVLFEFKAQLEALQSSSDVELKNIKVDIEQIRNRITAHGIKFTDFKTDEFNPVKTNTTEANASLNAVKILLTIITLLVAGISIYIGVR